MLWATNRRLQLAGMARLRRRNAAMRSQPGFMPLALITAMADGLIR